MIGPLYLAGVGALVVFALASGAKVGAVLTLLVLAWIVWTWIDQLR